ncbi:MAG: methylated-DNA--[protein]-cysteine S-methyltransferase [Candidatus Rokuibacteriota bacterium]
MIEPELLLHQRIQTPVGYVLISGTARAVNHVTFEGSARPPPLASEGGRGPVADAARQTEEYFSRSRKSFDVPVAPIGTAFQLRVWNELKRVPYGTTVSYGDIARRIGQPSASRAVGAANGANPIPIIIPCHRAIGADGSLTGFGGGLAAKRTMLQLESSQRPLEATQR